ncbi:MAG: SPOR domain-containing protein [Salinisphaera sp.]|jgi:cell division septation protein DedD|nr:SPOR domain-containing protein [Salinisphaera sp.]
MARDYSSRQNNPPSKNGKRKPTRRAAPAAKSIRQKKRGGGTPGFVWLLCGLCIGVTVAAGFYIFARPAGTPGHDRVSINLPNGESPAKKPTADTAVSAHADNAQAKQPDAKPRFSFYKMLPNYRVEVPDGSAGSRSSTGKTHDEEPSNSTPPPTSASAAPSPDSKHTAASTSSPPADSGHGYVIQAGAFSHATDAERRKARLALLGITAEVVDVKSSSGKTIYRVQSDTIASRSEVDDFMHRLDKHQIEGLVRQADQ